MTKEAPQTLAEMIERAFAARPLLHSEIEQRFLKLQQEIKGKKDEFVLIYYTGQVPHMHRFGEGYTYRSDTSFRLGILDGEELVWGDLDRFSSITLPVSRYVEGEKPKEAIFKNIFSQEGDMVPPTLGYHLVPEVRTMTLGLGLPREASINELLIGDDIVREWLRVHALYERGYFNKAAKLLSKLILEPMGENDGPTPHQGRDPIGW